MKRWMTKHFQGDTVEEYLDEGDMRRQRVFVTLASNLSPFLYFNYNNNKLIIICEDTGAY